MFKLVFKLIKTDKIYFSIIFLLNLLSWITLVLQPNLLGKYIDILKYTQEKSDVYIFVKIFSLLIFIKIISTYLRDIYLVKLKTKVVFNLNINLIAHILELPLNFFNNNMNSSYLNHRVNSDSNTIVSFVLDNIFICITQALTFIYVIYYLINANLQFALILILITPLNILVYLLYKKVLYNKNYDLVENQNRFFSKMNNIFLNVKFIKINSFYELSKNELINNFEVLLKSVISYIKKATSFTGITTSIYQLSFIMTVFLGGILIINDKLTLGTFIAINSYINLFLSCISYFLELSKSYQTAMVSYTRIKEIYDIPKVPNGNLSLNKISSIELKNINFSYNNSKIFTDLNYKFNKGNIYFINGKNGAGKSTLINLIIGLVDNYTGEVLFDNINIKKLNMNNVRKELVGVVEQEPFVINASIKDSITYGLDNINFSEVLHWCHELQIYDFILGLPNNFDYNINEKSNNISGGEKQKLSQIRIFLKNPDVIILDEPNSALDVKSLENLKNIITKIKKDKIIVIISHNQEFLTIADEIINI